MAKDRPDLRFTYGRRGVDRNTQPDLSRHIRARLAWIQHGLSHVRAGGMVVLLLPAAVANRRAGRRIRANLIRAGVLRAVLTLPSSLTTAAPGRDLWLLRRPTPHERPPSHLLVVDAAEDLPSVEPTWRTFLDDPEADLPGRSRAVRIIDLLHEHVDLTPGRLLALGARERSEDFRSLRMGIQTAVESIRKGAPQLEPTAQDADQPMTTVGDLAKSGVVTIHQAPLRMATDEGDTRVLTARDVRHGRPPTGWSMLAEGALATEAGDVVMSVLVRDPVVRVLTDVEAGVLLGPQLVVLRTDPERNDPHFLAGCLGAAAAALGAGPGWSRVDARRVPVPLLSLTSQRAYGQAFRQVGELGEAIRNVAELGDRIVRLGLRGLAAGSLRPGE